MKISLVQCCYSEMSLVGVVSGCSKNISEYENARLPVMLKISQVISFIFTSRDSPSPTTKKTNNVRETEKALYHKSKSLFV